MINKYPNSWTKGVRLLYGWMPLRLKAAAMCLSGRAVMFNMSVRANPDAVKFYSITDRNIALISNVFLPSHTTLQPYENKEKPSLSVSINKDYRDGEYIGAPEFSFSVGEGIDDEEYGR